VAPPPACPQGAAGRDVIMRTDVQGARYIKSVCPGAVTIFVQPPSWEEMEWRLRSRGTDDTEQLELRLRVAREELAAAEEFDPVVNDDLNACVAAIERILAAERSRKKRERVVV
jgi:guanylate kinase